MIIVILNRKVIIQPERLLVISDEPFKQLLLSISSLERGLAKQSPRLRFKKKNVPPIVGMQYEIPVASAAPSTPIFSNTIKI